MSKHKYTPHSGGIIVFWTCFHTKNLKNLIEMTKNEKYGFTS